MTYDLIFNMQVIRKDELGKDLYESKDIIPDLNVYLSSTKREPTAANCERHHQNKFKFIMKC